MSWESVRLACRGDGQSSHCAMYGTIYRDFRVSWTANLSRVQEAHGCWFLVCNIICSLR
jgi:hypothetical protein